MLLHEPPFSRPLDHRLVRDLIEAASRSDRTSDATQLLERMCRAEDVDSKAFATLCDLRFLDEEGWRTRRNGPHAHLPRPRIFVSCHMTSHGNLSVRVLPYCYRPSGRWDWADEWSRDVPLADRSTAWGERPWDELLYFQKAEELTWDHSGYGRRDAHEARIRPLQARTIVAMFWAAVDRLAGRFDVAIGGHPVAIERAAPFGPVLRIVDTIEEDKIATRQAVEGFRDRTGHPPDRFWSVCARSRYPLGGLNREDAARRLNRYGGTKLTPRATEDAHRLLEKAAALGVYRPPADTAEPDPIPDRPRAKTAVPAAPPSYRAMRTYMIDSATAQELGVEDTRELVDCLNALLAARGAEPIDATAYPKTRRKLTAIVAMYRTEVARILGKARRSPTRKR